MTLIAIGLKPVKPEGGYFITADFSALDLDHIIPPKGSSGQHRGDALVKWLLLNKRLAVMPTFTFYSPEHANFSQNQIRFCFNKEMETIERAKGILLHWGEELRVKKDKEY
jgi:aspartate/methionine/tyrosine aminotransferase